MVVAAPCLLGGEPSASNESVSKYLPALRQRWIGLAAGVMIYFVMGNVVLLLSAVKVTPRFACGIPVVEHLYNSEHNLYYAKLHVL